MVAAQAYTINRNPEVFANPDKWDPNRWIDISTDCKRQMKKAMFTFSQGRRGCAGSDLAEYLMLAVIAHLVMRYEITPTEHSRGAGMKTYGGFIAHARRASNGQYLPLNLKRTKYE